MPHPERDAIGRLRIASIRNPDAQQIGVWFALRVGMHPNKVSQAARNAQGEASFV
jgi:hypothetical protein